MDNIKHKYKNLTYKFKYCSTIIQNNYSCLPCNNLLITLAYIYINHVGKIKSRNKLKYKLKYIYLNNCLQAIQKQRRKILVVVITKQYPYKCCGIFQILLRILKMSEDKIPTELVNELLDGADNDPTEPEAGSGANNIDKSQSTGRNVSLIDGSAIEETKENERRYSLFMAEPFDEPKPKTKPFVPEKKPTTNWTHFDEPSGSVRVTDVDEKNRHFHEVHFNTTKVPEVRNDWRSSSSFTGGSLKKSKTGITKGRGIPYSASFEGQKCLCGGSDGTSHQIHTHAPSLIVIGDNFCPPAIGGEGDSCPLVIRVDKEPPTKVFELFKELIGNAKDKTKISPNSTILVNLQAFLGQVGVDVYISMVEKLMDKISDYLQSQFPANDQGGSVFSRAPKVLHYLVPYEYVSDEFDTAMSYLNFYVSSLEAKLAAEIPGYAGYKGASNAFREMMTSLNSRYMSDSKILGGWVLDRYGIEETFLVGSQGKIEFFQGIGKGNCDKVRQLNPIAEYTFWTSFFEKLSKTNLSLPKNESIALGILRGGNLNPTESEFLKKEAGISDIIEGDSTKLNIILCGHSEMKRLASKMRQLNAGCDTINYVSGGACPTSSNTYYGIINKIKEISTCTSETIVYISCIGNNLIRNKWGEISFSQGHHLNRSDMINPDQLSEVIKNILLLTEKLTDAGYKVIVLGPTPRYFSRCCDNFNHFSPDFNPSKLNEMIRDLNTYLGRYLRFKLLDNDNYVGFVHPEVVFSHDIWKAGSVIDQDNVHLKPQQGEKFARFLFKVAATYVRDERISDYVVMASLGKEEDFAEWLRHYRGVNSINLPEVKVTRDHFKTAKRPHSGFQPGYRPHKKWKGKKK